MVTEFLKMKKILLIFKSALLKMKKILLIFKTLRKLMNASFLKMKKILHILKKLRKLISACFFTVILFTGLHLASVLALPTHQPILLTQMQRWISIQTFRTILICQG
jgi:hypothetical protein